MTHFHVGIKEPGVLIQQPGLDLNLVGVFAGRPDDVINCIRISVSNVMHICTDFVSESQNGLFHRKCANKVFMFGVDFLSLERCYSSVTSVNRAGCINSVGDNRDMLLMLTTGGWPLINPKS